MKDLVEIINKSKHIVFLTGAGLSTASGIPDFRSSNGLYNSDYSYPPEEILSRSFFDKNHEEFYKFYRDKMIYLDALPNDAHKAIAKLEKMGKRVTVVTQNIDGLHQAAGSSDVLELHGGIKNNYCMKCGCHYSLEDILDMPLVPRCSCGGIIKPDVVLYEENLNMDVLERSLREISKCDTLIVCGTSLLVNPASSLVRYYRGNDFVIINLSKTPYDSYCDLLINEPVEVALKFILGEEDAK